MKKKIKNDFVFVLLIIVFCIVALFIVKLLFI